MIGAGTKKRRRGDGHIGVGVGATDLSQSTSTTTLSGGGCWTASLGRRPRDDQRTVRCLWGAVGPGAIGLDGRRVWGVHLAAARDALR